MGKGYEAEFIRRALAFSGKPGVHVVPIYHDDWCKLLKGKGACNCNPDVGKPETVAKG